MRLRRAVRDLNKAEMKVVVEDGKGNLSQISHTWMTEEGGEAPIPATWLQTTGMEFHHQRIPESGPTDIHQILGS